MARGVWQATEKESVNVLTMPSNLENSTVANRLTYVSLCKNNKERRLNKVCKLLDSILNFTCYQITKKVIQHSLHGWGEVICSN